MSPIVIGCIAFVCVFGAALGGMALRTRLPDHHLATESREAIKLATAIIGTLSALALGLLIASAKRTFDDAGLERRTSAARVLLLDRVLAQYGPEAQPLRVALRKAVEARLSAEKGEAGGDAQVTEGFDIEALQQELRTLTPDVEPRRLLQARALQISSDIAEARWLRTESEVGGFPTPFLIVLILWFALLFASFGLLAPGNGTVVLTLLVCSFSVSLALVLVIDMDHPYLGFIQVSDAPFRTALERLGRP